MEVGLAHAETVQALPWHHGGPFDRLLVAQAVAEGLTLVTRDPAFKRYAVKTLKA